jgi:cellulose synthase/poly-beta-1,6-N-acetylglucosamine synthase-like glycosyltransferase
MFDSCFACYNKPIMDLPKISVVVPSFNKRQFIGKTIDSIISQNYPNLEIIIQDGSSTDGTLEIIKKYAQKYPKIIKFESKKDKGQWDAINKGFDKVTGEILTFINADDFYEKGAFFEVAKTYQKNPDCLWIAGKGEVVNNAGKEVARLVTFYKNLLLFLNLRTLLLIVNYLIQPSVFITRKAWQEFGPFVGAGKFVMEYDLWLKISKEKMPLLVNKNLSSFRMSGENASSTSFEKLLKADEEIVQKYTKNHIILFLHKFHNFARAFMVKLM